MIKISISLILLCGLLSSCYFVDDIFDPDEPEEESLQEKSQDAVTAYMVNKISDNYEPYGYGTITINKPLAIQELEELEKARDEDGEVSASHDSLIAKKKRFIEAYGIEITIELDHFFTITDSTNQCTVFETAFILNDTLGVEDVTAKIFKRIPSDYVSILNFFFYEKPIFLTPSYQDSKTLSKNFYGFFKQELEKKMELSDKSDFLLHALRMTREVKLKGEFDQQYVMEKQAKEFFRDERPDIKEYKSVAFTPLYESEEATDKDLSGYYFFHKFIGEFQKSIDTNVVLIEFSTFYELENIYQMERPFNQYFDN